MARFAISNTSSSEDLKLLSLGYKLCETPLFLPLAGGPAADPFVRLDDASSAQGDRVGGSSDYLSPPPESTQVGVFLRSGASPASVLITAARSSEGPILPQATVYVGASPFLGHRGMRILNEGFVPVSLRLQTTHPPRDTVVSLAGKGDARLAPVATGDGAFFFLGVQNLTSLPVEVTIEETGYDFPVAVGTGSPGPGPFQGLLRALGLPQRSLSVTCEGRDANPGRTVLVVAHAPAWPVVAVVPGAELRGGVRLVLSPPRPNPSTRDFAFRYTLSRPERMRIILYDVRGRVVAQLEDEAGGAQTTGELIWDGKLAGGGVAPSGVYLYRAFVGGDSQAEGKLVRLAR